MAYVENFAGQIMPTSKLPKEMRAGIVGPYPLAPGEYFDMCPYDNSHLVRNVKMMYHLVKCRRNYIYWTEKKGEEVEYVPCPNRFCGPFPRPELEYHHERCKPYVSYKEFDVWKNKEFREKMRRMREVEKKNMAAFKANGIIGDEDWELESNGREPGYNPIYKLVRENILIMPPGITRMERREFRQNFIIPAWEASQKKKAETEAAGKAREAHLNRGSL